MTIRKMRLIDIIGGKPEKDQIFHMNIWFKSLNNARYANLLPRLERVDNLLLTCSARRYLRAIQFRALNYTMGAHSRLLFQHAARTYRYGFITNIRHLPFVRFPVVVDMDDPFFTGQEPELLGSPHVVAVVVTNQPAADRYRDMGLRTPIRVIGQGIEHSDISPSVARGIQRRKRENEATVGYVAAWHLTGKERNVDPAYDVDHLIDDLWPSVVTECPRARLWLVGGISEVLRRKLDGRQDIEVVGPVPHDHVPAYLSVFDATIYPRRIQHDRASIKVSQAIGAGVPTIGYRSTPTDLITRTGAGIVVDSPTDFIASLLQVLDDARLRARLSANARAVAAEVDWKHLGNRYSELLDEFLPHT